MPKNQYLDSAYEHFLSVQRPLKGWPRLPAGKRAYPVFRSKCSGALIAAPTGWKNGQHRSVKLPGQHAASKRHVNLKPLYPQTDPKGRPLFLNECTGSVVSFSKKGGKTRYYWPRRPSPVRRMAAVSMTTTANPLPRRFQSINHRRPGQVSLTLNPRLRRAL